MCKGVCEDSRHRIGHVDIRVGIMSSLECVCLSLHEYFGGKQPLLEVITTGLCSPPSWDPPFKYREYSRRRRSLEAAYEKKADVWL